MEATASIVASEQWSIVFIKKYVPYVEFCHILNTLYMYIALCEHMLTVSVVWISLGHLLFGPTLVMLSQLVSKIQHEDLLADAHFLFFADLDSSLGEGGVNGRQSSFLSGLLHMSCASVHAPHASLLASPRVQVIPTVLAPRLKQVSYTL